MKKLFELKTKYKEYKKNNKYKFGMLYMIGCILLYVFFFIKQMYFA